MQTLERENRAEALRLAIASREGIEPTDITIKHAAGYLSFLNGDDSDAKAAELTAAE